LECLVGKFYGTSSILLPFGTYIIFTFGIFVVTVIYFSRFGMYFQEKSGNPAWDNIFGQKLGTKKLSLNGMQKLFVLLLLD
jgi:hypothetical protein